MARAQAAGVAARPRTTSWNSKTSAFPTAPRSSAAPGTRGSRARRRLGIAFRMRSCRVERLAGEEHLRDEARQPHPAPHREVDVRRPPPVPRIGHRVGARLDGADLDRARLVGEHARRAVEVRVDRRVVVVVRMDVAPGGVALPHLDHRPADRRAVLVDHPQAQMHQLADRLLRAVAGDVGAELREALRLLVRRGQLGARERAALERSPDCGSRSAGSPAPRAATAWRDRSDPPDTGSRSSSRSLHDCFVDQEFPDARLVERDARAPAPAAARCGRRGPPACRARARPRRGRRGPGRSRAR